METTETQNQEAFYYQRRLSRKQARKIAKEYPANRFEKRTLKKRAKGKPANAPQNRHENKCAKITNWNNSNWNKSNQQTRGLSSIRWIMLKQ